MSELVRLMADIRNTPISRKSAHTDKHPTIVRNRPWRHCFRYLLWRCNSHYLDGRFASACKNIPRNEPPWIIFKARLEISWERVATHLGPRSRAKRLNPANDLPPSVRPPADRRAAAGAVPPAHASREMLPDKFPPMSGLASPNRVGGADGGTDQHRRAARGVIGGGGAVPVGEAGGEGPHPRRTVRDGRLASQAYVTRDRRVLAPREVRADLPHS
jgi:hypothetical protein